MLDFVKSDPAKKLRRELDAARARRSKLGARLDAAESHLSAARGEPIKLARDGAADPALDAAETKVKAAEARVSTLLSAISDEDGHIADLERQLADQADRAQRQETADRCDELSIEMERFEEKIQVLDDLAKLADVVAPIVTDASAIGHFARTARAGLVPALQLVSNLLNSHARSVRSGDAPATLPTPAPITVPLPPAPQNEAIWLREPVAFSENGQIVVRDMNQYLRLPPALATKAVDIGAGVRVGDPRAGKRVSSWRQWYEAGPLPELDRCKHLDSQAEAAAAKEKQKTTPHSEVVRHSAHSLFQPLDRGPAYQMRTSGPNHTPEEGGQ
jgi:hypothetical protein